MKLLREAKLWNNTNTEQGIVRWRMLTRDDLLGGSRREVRGTTQFQLQFKH